MKILNEADTQPIVMETNEKSLEMSHDILPCATLLVQDVRNKNRVAENERRDTRDTKILSSVQRTCAALKIQAVYRAFLGRSRLTMRDGRQATHTASLPQQSSFGHSRPPFSSSLRPAKLERQISDVTMSDFGDSTHHKRLGFSSHFACSWIAEGDDDHDNDDDDGFCIPAANDRYSDVMSNRLVVLDVKGDEDNTNYPNDVDARSNGIRDPFSRDTHSAPTCFKLERTSFYRTLNPNNPSDIQEAVSNLEQSSISHYVTEQATPLTSFDATCQGTSRRQKLKNEVGGVVEVGNVSVPGTNYKIGPEEERSVRLLNQSYDNVNCPRSDLRQNSGTIQNVKGNRISPSRSRMSSNRSSISKSHMDSRSIASSYSSRPQQEQELFIFPGAKKSTFPSSQKGKVVEESGSIHNSLNSMFSSTMSMRSSPKMPLRKVSSHNDVPTPVDGYNNSGNSSKSMIRPSPPTIRQTERSLGICGNGSEYSPTLPIRKESTHGSTVDTNSHNSFYTTTTSSFDHPWGPCNNTVEMPSSRLRISQEYPIRQPQRRASLFQCPHASTNDDINTTTTDHSQSYDSNVFADEEILCTSFE